MKVKKKQMIKHSRFVLKSPFLDKTQEKMTKANEKFGYYSKKTMAVLLAISTMATPLMASPAYAKSSSSSSSVGTTSDSSKDVESSTSGEVNDEAGEEPEPYQCSGDIVDYENTELLTDGDGAGEITCAQSNGVYYKVTDGNKASSYHWIAWYRDKSQDEVDVSDDDGNYSGFSSSKVSAWTPYQSEIEELNDGAFPESKSYTYPTDTTTGSLDFWADIAGNYTVLGDPKYDSLELTAYEQVVYARTEEVEEPYEIPSDEDVSADDAGGSAGGSSAGGSSTNGGGGTTDTGNGYENTGWSVYKYCNTQARKDVNEILNALGFNATTNNSKDKNGIKAEKELSEDFESKKNKIYNKINKIEEKYNIGLMSGAESQKQNSKAYNELVKIFNSDEFEKYYKEKKVYEALYIKNRDFVQNHQILTGEKDSEDIGESLLAEATTIAGHFYGLYKYATSLEFDNKATEIEKALDYAINCGMNTPKYKNFDVSKINDAKEADLFCTVTKRTNYGFYTKSDGTQVPVKIVKRHDNMGNTSYTKYAQNDSGEWVVLSKSNIDNKWECLSDYSSDDKENRTRNILKSKLGLGSSTEIDTKMDNFSNNSNDSISEKKIDKALSSDSDNEIIGDPEYEAGEAAYSEDSGYTVIKTSTTTYYYMNVEIAKATIDNVYATELAQLDNLGIVKGSGNNVQAKVSKDTDGFWGDIIPSYWSNEGTVTINNDSSTIYHFDTVDSRNGYGYTDDEYSVDLYSLLTDHDKISKFIHGYNNIKDSKASSKNYPKGAEENCITTKSSTGKSSQVCSKAQTPLMKQTLVINEDSQDQEELDDEQVETNVTLTKDNDKEDNSSDSPSN